MVRVKSRKKYRDGKEYPRQPYTTRTGHSGPSNPNSVGPPPVGFRYKRKGK